MWFQMVHSAVGKGGNVYQHAVREEPLEGSPEVGLLVAGLAVLAQAVVGEWAKVRYHKKQVSTKGAAGLRSDGWGWCLIRDRGVVYLQPTSGECDEVEEDDAVKESAAVDVSTDSTTNHASCSFAVDVDDDISTWQWAPGVNGVSGVNSKDHQSSAAQGAPVVDEWFERYDPDGGFTYYYNDKTGESSWDAPEYVIETDPISKDTYFLQLNKSNGAPVKSMWEAPVHYARLTRQQPAM